MNNKRLEASISIEKLVRDNPDLTYIEACLKYAEANDLEIKLIPKLISPHLKEKLYNESIKNKCVKSNIKPTSLNDFIR